MERHLIYPQDLEFLDTLQFAALRRLAVEVQLTHAPLGWKTIFIQRITIDQGEGIIHTLSGERIAESQIAAISPPFSIFNGDEIGCLCE